jgi:RHS repeat-associated protein
VVTLDSSGYSAARLSYYPFGGTRSTWGTLNTDELFTGQRLDDTGLYFYNARYYDATIGRFISADTLVQDPYDPQSLNRYSYCINNPLKYTDPSGHWLETVLDIASIAYDIYEITKDPNNAWNWVSLGADVACAILPVATGGGAAVRGIAKGANAIDNTADAVKAADRAHDYAKTIDKAWDVTRLDGASRAGKLSDGFSSHAAFKRSMGSPGVGNDWHHIVEQSQIRKSGFDRRLVHNPANELAINKATHARISGYYNSIDPQLSRNMRVRDWLAGQSFDEQYRFGLNKLNEFGY